MHRAGTSDKMLPCNSALIAAGYCSSPGQTGADVHRKVFRIEQMAGERRTPSAFVRAARTDGNDVQTLRRELSGVRETLAADMRALAGLLHEGKERRMARAAGELGAAVNAIFMDHYQKMAWGHFMVRSLERKHGQEAVLEAWGK